jgi:5-methylcytosine-specific restriction endonuclease McrA
MVRLEKNNPEAIAFVENFIQGQWQEDRYINIGYDDIDRDTLRRFCREEQDNVCCYCCRDLSGEHVTLEHIVPRSCNEAGALLAYQEVSPVLMETVVLQNQFARAETVQALPPFPHHIAYQNIVAACAGRVSDLSGEITCCNPNRGNDFLLPFNVLQTHKQVEYAPDGTVYVDNDTTWVDPINLNAGILKKIRRLWYKLAQSGTLDWQAIEAAKTIEARDGLLLEHTLDEDDLLSDRYEIQTFRTDFFWEIFLKYKFFFSFFREQRVG